jgi:aspartate beta-hydroxylase
MGAGWTAFRLQRLGEWNRENMALFPKSTAIIQSLDIPLAVRGIMFARQLPGSGVQSHSDGRNFILTAHLGLAVPKTGCWISVAGVKKEWEQNKVIILDTSFTHETGNESNEERYVMIIDFWHPELTLSEREALQFIFDARNKFETERANEIECSYVKSGKPIDLDVYIQSKESFGSGLAKLFNPFKR